MVVRAILKATYKKSVDQNGELFNYVLEHLLDRIVPKIDPVSKELKTKYNKEKTNLGNYILVTCYWSVRAYQDNESYNEGLVSCGDFMEDYSEVSEQAKIDELSQLKFISKFDEANTYVPVIQNILRGETIEN